MTAANAQPKRTAPGPLKALAVVSLIVACAHTQQSALIITASTLDAAGVTFEAVAAGMQTASDNRALTREQVLAWNDFLERWRKGYKLACADWRAAKAKGDASGAEQAGAAVGALIGQLNEWASVLAKSPTSYELPREEPSRYSFCEGARCYPVEVTP